MTEVNGKYPGEEAPNAVLTGCMVKGNPLPMWIYDRKTLGMLEVSDGALRTYGYSREEFLELTPRDLRPSGEFEATLVDVVDGDRRRVWTHVRKDGELLLIKIHSNALRYNGRVARLVVARDVTQRMAEQAELKQLAMQDWMTGLPSHLYLPQRAQEAFEHADRTRRHVAIVRLDMDQFDEVLVRFGQEAADQCLQQVTKWLTRRLRGMDTVARTHGEQFTLVLAELDDDFDLYRVASALLKVFAEPVMVDDEPVVLSASLGIAVYPEDGRDFDRLCRAAELAMRQAKETGGHRIAMFSNEGKERTELDVYMRETMERKNFRLHYQPEYSPEGEIRTLEALLRLPGKLTGFVAPDRFIPIAEETGLIEPLGLWVIAEASRQVKEWRDKYGEAVRIAVNVSPLQLRSKDFAADALSVMEACDVDPRSMEFEITERAVLNFDEAAAPMRELAQAGITFAVDDFGTGYSSLQHLHRLPISVLKIDRSFVQRMDAPRGTEAIVEAIVSMAHSLGMKVVAEGVETESQRDAALKMGCDAIQGFLHSRPVAADQIPALMGWTRREEEAERAD